MVGTGSSAYILYFGTFEKLGLTEKDLVPMASTLTEFTGHSISPLNTTTIPVTIGEEPKFKTLMIRMEKMKEVKRPPLQQYLHDGSLQRNSSRDTEDG
ncbi:hypothetical protein B296_00036994 [Ensete ventricosum]|uniref:Uncharacterized protein n=1 Tax=Ensete ventricosum TaxID=4639 RepID=A0A426ZVN3_ENSVE|nr:hypothetical protein B296_00036994 [Ensete ventricosum]